jgi:hypothetical protein
VGDLATTAKKSNLIWAAALLLLTAWNLLLYAPLFHQKEFPYRGSIEAGYAATARFIAENPNPWGWNPQSYAGQPTQFTYPPLLPYLSALLQWSTGAEALWATRWLVAAFACLLPGALALAFAWMSGSRLWALGLGLLVSFASPAYGLFFAVNNDRGVVYLPWRLQTFAKYGEGPHLIGLTLLVFIVAALVWGAKRKDLPSLFLMALALAIAPLLNWLAAFGLTITVLLLFLTDLRLAPRILLAGFWAYALAAFWLTPDYIFTTIFNWPKDAYEYKVNSRHWIVYLGLALLLLFSRLFLWALRAPWGVTFTTLGTLTFGWIAGGFYWFNRDTLPESRRYLLELEVFLFASGFAWLAWRWQKGRALERIILFAAILALTGAVTKQAVRTAKRTAAAWKMIPAEETIEYRAARWLDAAQPAGRVFASGGTRFHLNAFTSLPQVGGTFESGLRNRIAVDYLYQITTGEGSAPGEDGQDALRQMQALGVEYFVVHGPQSTEYYRDIKNPLKLEGLAQAAHRLTAQDVIYRIPFQSLAHLVKPEELPANKYKDTLPPLVAAIQDHSRPKLSAQRISPSHYRISGNIPAGYEVFFSMNYDPGWAAEMNGQQLPLGKNNLGLIRIAAPASPDALIDLRFLPTRQQLACAALSALAWVGSLLVCLWSGVRSRRLLMSSSLAAESTERGWRGT